MTGMQLVIKQLENNRSCEANDRSCEKRQRLWKDGADIHIQINLAYTFIKALKSGKPIVFIIATRLKHHSAQERLECSKFMHLWLWCGIHVWLNFLILFFVSFQYIYIYIYKLLLLRHLLFPCLEMNGTWKKPLTVVQRYRGFRMTL